MAYNINKINQTNNYRVAKPDVEKQYSAIKMANTVQGTGDMGLLIPVHVQELIPSQKISLQQTVGIQYTPFVTNLMHQLSGEIIKTFVPYRLIWDKWETFITGGIDGKDTTPHPTINLHALYQEKPPIPFPDGLTHTLADYFSMPINSYGTTHPDREDLRNADDNPSAFLWWAYNRFYNDHIRILDIEPTEIDKNNNEVLRGNWDWDYFTRSRVFQQRGDSPSVPINDTLEQLHHEIQTGNFDASGNWTAHGEDIATGLNKIGDQTKFVRQNKNILPNEKKASAFEINQLKTEVFEGDGGQIYGHVRTMPHSLTALGMDMNDFIVSLGIMRMQVNNSKVQPRYVDQLEIRYGVYPQDARLQRAEYLGSNYFNISTDTVTNVGSDTKQGQIQGQAWGNGENMQTEYNAQEHGVLMTLMIIRPKSVYEGGLPKIWTKKTRFDYPTPELANTPDRKVLKQELYYNANFKNESLNTNHKIFGWQGIYEEYRTLQNQVVGKLRPSKEQNLTTYTLARFWNSEPSLNKTFIQCKPDQERILLYTKEPAFIYFIRNEIYTSLPLPIQSEPGEMNFL